MIVRKPYFYLASLNSKIKMIVMNNTGCNSMNLLMYGIYVMMFFPKERSGNLPFIKKYKILKLIPKSRTINVTKKRSVKDFIRLILSPGTLIM